ncbi:MAG TPA: ATP-binding protein [Solirubrobacterales bacterium]|nr:ATP-binding protein [Solirubrobacterales bacterium]
MPGGENKRWNIDFLANRPRKEVDAQAQQLREAENVISSYSKASDFLAEALQNGADAIDARRARAGEGEETVARIHIEFDRAARRFSVLDTGTGMSRPDLEIVLTPNVTLKSGPQRRAATSRSRGHKGVGLSFLALAANDLRIQTCDGTARHDVVVKGGERWAHGGGQTDKPIGRAVTNPPDELLGSSTYTLITVADADFAYFDADLYELGCEQLIWLLRTQTAVGNTGTLFGEQFGAPLPPEENIEVTLDYVAPSGRRDESISVDYSYATPEELVPANRVVGIEELEDLDADERARKVRGAAVRYVDVVQSDSGRDVKVYFFAIDGRDMNKIAKERRQEGEFFPREWQGYYVATLGMPTGVEFRPDVIQPRTYERRMFALLQDDALKLDLGRKTLAGRQKSKLKSVVRNAWQSRLVNVVPHLQPLAQPADDALFRALVERAASRPDLNVDVPYAKAPQEELGVLALFHELLGHGNGYLPPLRTLHTGLFTDTTDSILLPVDGGPEEALHVLFGTHLGSIMGDLEREDGSAASADLAVVWDADAKYLGKRAVEVERVEGDNPHGATHLLQLHGAGGLEDLQVIALRTLIEEQA